MSSAHEKQALLINALVKANRQGKLIWNLFEDESGCVFTNIKEKVLYINEHHNEGLDSVKIEIYVDGKLAESFLDDDLSSTDVVPAVDKNWYITMTSLLEHSRRIATGADEVLDSILKDLGERL